MMRARKSLGQHFLTSKRAVNTIIRVANLTKNDTVVEIGPGKGVLTRALLGGVKQVIAIEKDERLASKLSETFREGVNDKRLIVASADALLFDPSDYGLTTNNYKLVANIPYYITGALLEHMLTLDVQPGSAVLLLQKEVAERIAKSRKESILSLSVKAYGKPRYIETVGARYFKPKPKVDSAILAIEHISRDFFDTITEEAFFKLVRLGFSQKRKQLLGNLSAVAPRKELEELFAKYLLSPRVRAEDISLSDWKKITESLSKQK